MSLERTKTRKIPRCISIKHGYDPKKNYIFSLKTILNNDRLAVERFCDSIKRRGYSFVRVSDYLVKQIDLCTNSIDEFLNQTTKYKESFGKKPIFGYFNAKHKESFRILTGKRLIEHKYPNNFDKIISLAKFSDSLMYRLSLICSKHLFPIKTNSAILAKSHRIPLFEANFNERWGMLDATKYFNNNSKSGLTPKSSKPEGKRLNCDEHYDPGFLSIHYRSTQPGLQLKNEYGKWINPPNDKNVAIIWAGDAATKINPNIKHGFHRVVAGKSNVPRIALWYEICTRDQEHKELMYEDKKKLENKEHETGIPISKTRSPIPQNELEGSISSNSNLDFAFHQKNTLDDYYRRAYSLLGN